MTKNYLQLSFFYEKWNYLFVSSVGEQWVVWLVENVFFSQIVCGDSFDPSLSHRSPRFLLYRNQLFIGQTNWLQLNPTIIFSMCNLIHMHSGNIQETTYLIFRKSRRLVQKGGHVYIEFRSHLVPRISELTWVLFTVFRKFASLFLLQRGTKLSTELRLSQQYNLSK